jgi:hypothetical protein
MSDHGSGTSESIGNPPHEGSPTDSDHNAESHTRGHDSPEVDQEGNLRGIPSRRQTEPEHTPILSNYPNHRALPPLAYADDVVFPPLSTCTFT